MHRAIVALRTCYLNTCCRFLLFVSNPDSISLYPSTNCLTMRIAAFFLLYTGWIVPINAVFGQSKKAVPITQKSDRPDAAIMPSSTDQWMLKGRVETPHGMPVGGVNMAISALKCSDATPKEDTVQTTTDGAFAFSGTCRPAGKKITVTPFLNDPPLHGINVWDMILISRHILDLAPLNSPYKIIAADVNSTGGITSADIVVLRQLILGSASRFPNNNSWRFFDKNAAIVNTESLFMEINKHETITLKASDMPYGTADFVACKIGDVDWSAAVANRPAPAGRSRIFWELPKDRKTDKGTVIAVPLRYEGPDAVGMQCSFRYDPSRWKYVTVSGGNLQGVSPACFHHDTDRGSSHFCWYSNETDQALLHSGDTICYLYFESLTDGASEKHLALEKSGTETQEEAVWMPHGERQELVSVPGTATERDAAAVTARIIPTPNPSTGPVTLRINAPEAGTIRLALLSAFGQRLLLRSVPVSEGIQQLTLPESAQWPAGAYRWSARWPDGHIEQGQWLLQRP